MQTDNHILPKESLTDMYKNIRDNESLLNFYTGLPNTCLFNYILEIVKQRIPYKCKALTQGNSFIVGSYEIKAGAFTHRSCIQIFSFSFKC